MCLRPVCVISLNLNLVRGVEKKIVVTDQGQDVLNIPLIGIHSIRWLTKNRKKN